MEEREAERARAVEDFGETLRLVEEWLARADPPEAEAFAARVERPFRRVKRELWRILSETPIPPP